MHGLYHSFPKILPRLPREPVSGSAPLAAKLVVQPLNATASVRVEVAADTDAVVIDAGDRLRCGDGLRGAPSFAVLKVGVDGAPRTRGFNLRGCREALGRRLARTPAMSVRSPSSARSKEERVSGGSGGLDKPH